jgi:hypothetical protein
MDQDKGRYLNDALAIVNGVIEAGADLPSMQALNNKTCILREMGDYNEAIVLADKVLSWTKSDGLQKSPVN